MKSCLLLLVGICLLLLSAGALAEVPDQATTASRPNILFCMADDWGWPHAGAYGDKTISTPNFDRLAHEGILFQQAYAPSPSCTPCRNSLITGKHIWELGSGANLWSTLPVEHESFIHMLRDSGYFTGRSSHKQWGPGNIQSWEEHHGDHPATQQVKKIGPFLDQYEAKRTADDQPFFYWLAHHDPHRGYRKGQHKNSNIDPDKVQMFEHFPNVAEVREDVADYYFAIQRWDKLVGTAIAEIEKRGLLENTIIIMTGDHGMPFPRAKANLYDSGTRVPLAIRWGAKIKPGKEIDAFVSLGDFAPTLLEIAGVNVPDNMTMKSFASLLTKNQAGPSHLESRQDIILGRERHTPSQSLESMVGYPSRGLRTKELLYIRNYEPDRWPIGMFEPSADGKSNIWLSDCDGGPTKTYIIDNHDRDEEHRRAFKLCFDKRPAEELYDVVKDPEQLHNVAKDPAYADAIKQMRKRLQERLIETNDPRAANPNYTGFDDHPYLGGRGPRR
ncbi:MAG: sulfatase [Phycisphaeraceae bacterium]|nr:sulfatase [Phycisphaeraceae bacterium]